MIYLFFRVHILSLTIEILKLSHRIGLSFILYMVSHLCSESLLIHCTLLDFYTLNRLVNLLNHFTLIKKHRSLLMKINTSSYSREKCLKVFLKTRIILLLNFFLHPNRRSEKNNLRVTRAHYEKYLLLEPLMINSAGWRSGSVLGS